MATKNVQQPPWDQPAPPTGSPPIPLKIYNSLTRNKSSFFPIDRSGKKVTWYVCGPTVYDDSHLGHARNYMTSDIIRRIMRDYFGFEVRYVMNITDIDDKIILRGRQEHLLREFKLREPDIQPTAKQALEFYLESKLRVDIPNAEPVSVHSRISESYADLLERNTVDDDEAKRKMHVKTVLAASRAMVAMASNTEGSASAPEDSKEVDEILMAYLDSRLGNSVDAKDYGIFSTLTKRHEERFMEDMRALNVLDPDDITRVSEYVPFIVDFIAKIQKNGFAYQSSNGVYFDVEAFEKAKNHYARLEPWSRGDLAKQAEGEGAISGKEQKGTTEKKSSADFALWKFSKPGEPRWPSPWGEGRPGWHIECSAMASDKLGKQFDIHSGGIDLAFPHHDNELAQSEAYWATGKGEVQWVNYFMHIGHLSIAGAKMSKSLKNYTTIRDALARGDWTPRGLRIVILLGGWREGIEITDSLVKAGVAWEDKVNNFFLQANDLLDRAGVETMKDLRLNDEETKLVPQLDTANATRESSQDRAEEPLMKALSEAKTRVYDALLNSFNTNGALVPISELITTFNSAAEPPSTLSTHKIGRWITSMVRMLGLDGAARPSDRGIGWSGLDIPESARPILTAITSLRDQLRSKSRSPEGITWPDIQDAISTNRSCHKPSDIPTSFTHILSSLYSSLETLEGQSPLSIPVLAICDQIRDVALWDQGIYLEDRDGGKPTLIRPVTRELRAVREEKEAREAQRLMAKAEREAEAAAQAEKGKLSHTDMYCTEEYSAWDENGIPTRDKAGEEVTKSKTKKLKKDWERQKKLHEAWLASNGSKA